MLRAVSRKPIVGETVSPFFYGAAGNGVVDDSAAVLAAINSGRAVDLSGGTWAVGSVAITTGTTCPGMFSDGSGTVVPISGSTSSTVLFAISKSDFEVEKVFFDMPSSTNSVTAPACDRALYFTDGARHSVINCRFRGGKHAIVESAFSDGYFFCQGNLITGAWLEGILVDQPNIAHIIDNQVTDGGFNSACSGAIRVGTSTQLAIAESATISGNIISRYCQGLAQEAIDASGIIRNLLISDNVITDTGNGGIEIKTFTPSFSPYVYQNIEVTGNAIRLTNVTVSVGIAVNLTGTPPAAGTPSKISISDNLIMSDAAPASGESVYGITTTGYVDLSIDSNAIFNVNQGILLNGAGVTGTTLQRCYVKNNTVYAVNSAIGDSTGTLQDIFIDYNTLYATTGVAVSFDGSSTINNLKMEHNYIESAASYAIELADVNDSRVAYNTIVSRIDGVLTQGDACSNVEFYENSIKTTGGSAGHAFRLGTGTGFIILSNRIDVPIAARVVVGAGTYTAAGNVRGMVSADPSATVAGSLGDLFLNSAVASGGFEAWICTTAGNAGAAVYKGARAIA